MKRGFIWAATILLLLVGCDKEQKKVTIPPEQRATATSLQATTEAFGPRSRPLPQADALTFETPLTAGDFRRVALSGHTAGLETGGQQATYQIANGSVVLNVYYYDNPDDAVNTVRFALSAETLTRFIQEPRYSASGSFGVAQDQYGAFLAAWSHRNWVFLARTTNDLSVLQSFLASYPY